MYEKINWENTPSTATPINSANLNKMDTAIADLNGLSATAVNIYVDATLGNDTTGTGAIATPYKTIQKAFDVIPKVIDNTYTIYLADGTYNEEATLKSVTGGTINIFRKDGQVDATSDTGVFVKSLFINRVKSYVLIRNITAINSDTVTKRGIIYANLCNYVSVDRCRFASSSKTNSQTNFACIRHDGKSSGSLSNCVFDNQDVCIYNTANAINRIFSTNSITASCNVALYCDSAIMFLNGTNAWIQDAVTPIEVSNGGEIKRSNIITTYCGVETITPVPDTPTVKAVTFPAGMFTSNDIVVQVTARTEVPGTAVLGVGARDITKTGFNLWLTRTNTTDTVLMYTAMQYQQGG